MLGFSLPDRWKPYILRTETCAQSNSHCRTGGNVTSQGLKPVPDCRTGGNLTSQGLKPVLGPILIVGQVETLDLKD